MVGIYWVRRKTSRERKSMCKGPGAGGQCCWSSTGLEGREVRLIFQQRPHHAGPRRQAKDFCLS